MLGAGISIGIGLSAGLFFTPGIVRNQGIPARFMETGGGPVNA
jgi:hypothetical protein